MARKLDTSTTFAEQRIINTQLNAKIEIVDKKFNQFMEEMRDRDNQRHAEIAAVNAKIDDKFEKILSQMQSMAIAAVVGVGAIVFAAVAILK